MGQNCLHLKKFFTAALLGAGLFIFTGYTGSAQERSIPVKRAGMLPGRWTAWSKKPALAWQDAFVTGNGSIGAMHLGAPGKERIICVHEELFLRAWGRNKIAVADIAGLLPQVRRMAENDSLTEAARFATDAARRQLEAMGAPQAWPVSPHPAFDLNIQTTTFGTAGDYRRQLNMETGESMIRWRDDKGEVEQAVFSSRANDVNVLRIRGLGARKLSVSLSLDETPGRTGQIDGVDISKAFRSINSEATDDGWIRYHAQYTNDPGGYEGVARVTSVGGRRTRSGSRIRIEDATEILVVLRITPLQYGNTSQAVQVKNELNNLSLHYEQLLRPHAALHGEMFRRVVLDLGAAGQWAGTPTEEMLTHADKKGVTSLFLEQLHAMGRYLLISSCGKYPPPLQGIWGGGWRPAWNGGFVFDSNVNLAIAAMSTGDLQECAASYFGYVERLLPAWRLNAKNYLGCRGFLVPHYSDPERGFLNHFGTDFPWMYWPSGAGWNLMPFYEHGMLLGDTAFLRTKVLPLYGEMAQFYEDYLVKMKDGYYHIIPGISPENNVGHQSSNLAKDCTIDIAVAREVFEHLLVLGKMFGAAKQDMDRWRHYHDQMLPYRVNADGALAEWAPAGYPDNYAHRHNSHLYPVFPGTEFLQPGANPALLQAARVALDRRFKYDTESAHGLIHISLMAARLQDADKVMENLNRFARRKYVYSGLVTSHNPDHAIYNLDAVLSLPRLLSEMLVFSQRQRIRLLPACPAGLPEGRLSGIRIHGGHKLTVSWAKGTLKQAILLPGKNDVCTITYGRLSKKIKLVAGRRILLDQQLNIRPL
ncbi:Glycosyl hydrolase family 65, N-terminal domain [Niabella drilacis]|uniref:Glycosyl hydrolase family 65, N-terminal domain n=1 Tax=Niabella drilacis (strain DSM 25811 / CCM 8410 / CCUG 62505 / LMG 26954 / E90) TaxID=1285928 RepID=A0A1G6R520_NIADE|nr:Glycosyl hydrolase family 65, N-terminal domain [Niabella drilacis]